MVAIIVLMCIFFAYKRDDFHTFYYFLLKKVLNDLCKFKHVWFTDKLSNLRSTKWIKNAEG